MDQRLPTGQLVPAAKPISQFLNYRSADPAAPGRQSLMGEVKGVRSVGGGGGMSVRGHNSFSQLAEALGPLVKTVDAGLQMYASNEYKKGQNEILKAAAQLNRDQNNASLQYAAENRQLSRLDRASAVLMDEVNPYRQAGRVNQVSQVAAQELPSMFRQLVAQNSSELAKADPGSPMLNMIRSGAVKVLTDKGLDEFSPGFQDYVLPVLNREWEDFQDKHLKAWVSNQKTVLQQQTGQQLYTGLMLGTDVTQLGGILQQSAMKLGIDGEPATFTKDVIVSTARQLQQIRDSGDPVLSQQAERALGQLANLPTGALGADGKPIPAGQAYGFEILQGTDQVAQITRRQRDNERDDSSRDFLSVYGQEIAGLEPGSDAHKAVMQRGLDDPNFAGLSRTEKIKLLTDAAATENGFQGLQVNENQIQDQFQAWENQYGSDWNEQEATARFNALMQQIPPGASGKKLALRKQYQELLKRKRQEAEGAINTSIFNANLKESLAANLTVYPDIDEAAVQGLNIEGLLAYGDSQRKKSSQAYASEFRRRGYAAIRAEAARLGVAELPVEKQQEALDRVSKEINGDKALMQRLFPPLKKPGAGGNTNAPKPEPPPGRKPAEVQTFTPGRLNSVPEERIKEWRSQPLLDASNTEKLLVDALNGKELPAPFRRAAVRAGTTPEQLLLQQVDLYPNFNFGLSPDLRKQILRQGNRAQGASNAGLGAAPQQVSSLLSNTTRIFADLLTGSAPAYARSFDPLTESAPGQPLIATSSMSSSVRRFRSAIINKESGGSYTVVNPDSGAIGVGQVMPENVGPWTERYLGKRLTPEQFRRSKKAQDTVVNGRFNDMIADQRAAGYNEEMTIRRAAAVWYSGNGNLWNSKRPEYSNGRRYPSIAEYTQSIWDAYRRNR